MEGFDQVFKILVNWQTMLLCLGVSMSMKMSRALIETSWRTARQNRFYNELFLPCAPMLMGAAIVSVAGDFPWPMEITESQAGIFMYGGVCGLLSGFVYARLRTTMGITAEKKRASIVPLTAPAPEA